MRALLIVGVIGILVRAASADDVADADALFAKAVELKQQGKTEEACRTFQQALDKNHNAVGTLLNVALCAANAGKVATAAKLFTDARDRAAEQKLEQHHQAAIDQLAKLEGHVPHLVLTFADPVTPETRVVIDDEMAPTTGDKIPVDPGRRVLVVTAPGRVAYHTTVDVPANGQDVAVAVPKLGLPVTVKSTKKTIGKVLVIGGSVAFVASIGLSVYADRKYNKQFDDGHCRDVSGVLLCDGTGFRQTGRAKTLARSATVVGGIGIAAAAVGVYLWVFTKQDHPERLSVVPTVDGDGAGVAAIGRF
jgi:hypothetical protein